ncbi:hypothetical protein HWV62_26120 [Athelia sp. TMB]|nr:hypothetical protein HWV62_26120 [Athelia sp. TMB]
MVVSAAGGDPSPFFEQWAREYGSVFRVPTAMGQNQLVLCDPKAISHLYSKETYGFVQTGFNRGFFEILIGRGLLWAEGDSHKRQRKALTPAFSAPAIRHMLPIFLDSAYKIKNAWDALLDGKEETIIDVEECLDTIGIAGFSHDFKTLEGQESSIANVFAAFGRHKLNMLEMVHLMLLTVFPILWRLPTSLVGLAEELSSTVGAISKTLLTKTRSEKIGEEKGDRSIMGLLIRASGSNSELRITDEEVLAQMKVLIVAVYPNSQWTLLELCRNPALQDKLREEQLIHFGSGCDPTYEQLSNNLPYLDAVVHETLRMHPPLWWTIRTSTGDDIIPLSKPIRSANGQIVDRISIAAGQEVLVPIRMINRSCDFWGPDAKAYKPERWLSNDDLPVEAKLLAGHRHLLTFSDGATTCLGKHFALAEFKAILSVLIRHYIFEFRDGSQTKYEMGKGLLPRPKAVGEEGCCFPLRVRRVE